MSKMAGIYSVSCPDLTVNHEWTIKKLNSVYKTKSLPNMPLFYDESEMKNIDTKTTGVSITFEIEEHDKKLSASCPNLAQNHEWTDQRLKSIKITKSLPNMALVYHEVEKGTKTTGVNITFEIEEHDKKLSASCPNLTQNHEWTDQRLKSIKITKSLPNMALVEKETKTTGVSITFEIEEHDKKLSASCPNLTQNHEWTDQRLKSIEITKSLPNMALIYHEVEKGTKTAGVKTLFL
ncbi:hypothetical protein AGLY_001517 [Aphis glycines]|uniref:Uncharacterized protein n=1 Tax=Aphis glycines TaxID=307491 RepID=A0A6G0U5E7_APHGL|nr:hypothetical protein AGLY_001517 [Aphis glycines]